MKKGDLEPLFTSWIEAQRLEEKAENTLKSYKKKVSRFIEWLPADEEITKDLMLQYKSYLLEELPAETTINSNIVAINKFISDIGLDKGLKLKELRIQTEFSNEENLSIADYKRLMRKAKENGDMMLYYVMKILTYTGIRIGELKYFTVENLNSNYIKVCNKGKYREIILRGDLLRELKRYAKQENIKTGYLFPSKEVKGKMIAASTIWRHLKKIAGKARVNKSKVHAHSFRHLFANLYLIEFGGSELELADIMGHSSLETTRKYTRSTSAQKKSQLEQMKITEKK